ncbi:myeloid-associated differentiation marker-like [Gouania willdenowi]|uniref:Myeloid-associated differentiation marker-like n=1 Tax=Gouania willdenowi TaxID=441366 RepID=A0A8C5GL91_GOUWI|nr:myeloid-associated differentiation marker-like [Gouania willdenowi]
MPVIVLEARDFTSPIFLVRTWALLCSCTTFSLVASLELEEANHPPRTFWIFCMFTWCFFFSLTLSIHILSVIQFHSLLPVSWKNLTVSVAVLGALMNLSSSVVFCWLLLDHQHVRPRPVAAAVSSCLTVCAYISESIVLSTRTQEQRGYLSSTPGLLKLLQLWGGCQMVPLVVEVVRVAPDEARNWSTWVPGVSYGVCILTVVVTLVVILGDLVGRCLLPFDRLLAAFSLTGLMLYMIATVICFTKVLVLKQAKHSVPAELVIMETAICSMTLLAYTVDFAFSVKLLCDRSHM